MKVLLINGSPHREGCTYTALCEVSSSLNQNGIDTDVFWIGNPPFFRLHCLPSMRSVASLRDAGYRQ